jgi:hypothetical protein
MRDYKLKFKYDGKKVEIVVKASSYANANYQATEYAIAENLPSHSLTIDRIE